MAPASNQGSRGGLIAAVVVFVILFVIAAIFAIYYNADLRKQEKALTSTQQQYEDISDLTGPELESLKHARSDPANNFNRNMKLLDVAVAQRDRLKKLIGGNDQQTTADVLKRATALTTSAADKTKPAGVVLAPGSDLVGTVNTLVGAVVSQYTANTHLQEQLAAANKQVEQAAQDKQTALADMQKAIAQSNSTAQKDIAQAVEGRQSLQGTLGEINAQQTQSRQAAIDAVNKKEQQIQAANHQIAQLQKDLDSVRAKLQVLRINTDDPILRQGDGQIDRIASNGIVFINRGQGDQITPGLTFEVYAKATGIPPVTGTGNPDSLPIGKASIEVIHVGNATSECRITRQSPGQSISPGDIIANLVYDPHTKYNFVVYGKFDLDHNGVATLQDGDIIKRLITQWGAHVANSINADTDFLVIGAEPQLPSFTADDLKDPINRKKMDDAQAALNAYQTVQQKAIDLHIPVLNQNRFLYLIGYYDLAAR